MAEAQKGSGSRAAKSNKDAVEPRDGSETVKADLGAERVAEEAGVHRVGVTSRGTASNGEGVAAPAGSGDTGPGTGTPSPADTQVRTPDRALSHRVGAAPLVAPDAEKQVLPAEGLARSSTNPIADVRALRSYTGETHRRFVDSSGTPISDITTAFAAYVSGTTYRVTNQRVYEEFYYRGSDVPMTRLLYPAGQRVTLREYTALSGAVTNATALRTQETSNPNHNG